MQINLTLQFFIETLCTALVVINKSESNSQPYGIGCNVPPVSICLICNIILEVINSTTNVMAFVKIVIVSQTENIFPRVIFLNIRLQYSTSDLTFMIWTGFSKYMKYSKWIFQRYPCNPLCSGPYPEPVYTGWSSVHWNATGKPLGYPVYTEIPLGHPANTCRVHWNTTGKTSLKQPHTGMPLEKLSWIRPTLGCHWRNSNVSSLHWNTTTGGTLTAHTRPDTYS